MWIPISSTLRAIDKQHFGPTSFTFLFVFALWWNVLPVEEAEEAAQNERTQQDRVVQDHRVPDVVVRDRPSDQVMFGQVGDDDDRLRDRG